MGVVGWGKGAVYLSLNFYFICTHITLQWRNMTKHQYIQMGSRRKLCILHHWGIQLMLPYNWARPAVLAAGKGRGGKFLFLLFFTFIHFLFSLLSLSIISSSTSLCPFSGRWHKMTHKGWHVIKPQHNQSVSYFQIRCFFFFNQKVLIFFLFLHENIYCGYSLEAPQRDASNEYQQCMFLWRNYKI